LRMRLRRQTTATSSSYMVKLMRLPVCMNTKIMIKFEDGVVASRKECFYVKYDLKYDFDDIHTCAHLYIEERDRGNLF
jgi:hypothetical protein